MAGLRGPENSTRSGLLPSVLGDFKSKKQTSKADAKSDDAASSDRSPTRKATDPQRRPNTLPEIVENSAQSPARKATDPPAMAAQQAMNEADSGKREETVGLSDEDKVLFSNSICSQNSMYESVLSFNGRKQYRSVNQQGEVIWVEAPAEGAAEDVQASPTDDADLLAELPWSNGRRTESTTATDAMTDDNGRYSTGRHTSNRSGTRGNSRNESKDGSTGNTANNFHKNKFGSTPNTVSGDIPKDYIDDVIFMPPSSESPRKAAVRNRLRGRGSLPDWPVKPSGANSETPGASSVSPHVVSPMQGDAPSPEEHLTTSEKQLETQFDISSLASEEARTTDESMNVKAGMADARLPGGLWRPEAKADKAEGKSTLKDKLVSTTSVISEASTKDTSQTLTKETLPSFFGGSEEEDLGKYAFGDEVLLTETKASNFTKPASCDMVVQVPRESRRGPARPSLRLVKDQGESSDSA